MVGSRVIEINCAFYKTQTEESHVKIQIPLRIAGDRRHVVKTGNVSHHRHHILSTPAQFGKAFGVRGSSFWLAAPISSHATMALIAASVAPIAMIIRKAC